MLAFRSVIENKVVILSIQFSWLLSQGIRDESQVRKAMEACSEINKAELQGAEELNSGSRGVKLEHESICC